MTNLVKNNKKRNKPRKIWKGCKKTLKMLRIYTLSMKVKSLVFIWRQAPIGPTIVNRQTNRAGLVNYLKVHSKVKT